MSEAWGDVSRRRGESFEDWKKRAFGIETLAEFKAKLAPERPVKEEKKATLGA